MQPDFAKIAPYLHDPLVLIGFFVFVSFLFARYLVKQRVIPPLPPKLGFRILKTILLYGFVIGLLLLCLGFALKYREIEQQAKQKEAELRSREKQAQLDRELQERNQQEEQEKLRREQEKLVSLLSTELDSNLKVAGELQKNSISLLNQFDVLTKVVRTPGIDLLTVMFPNQNLNLKYEDATAARLADQAFQTIVDTNLHNNDLQKQKLTAAARAIVATIDATRSTVHSLADPDHRRYKFSSAVWSSNLPVLRTVLVTDVTPFQRSYSNLDRLRDDYDVVNARFDEYRSSLREFLDPEKHSVNVESLRKVLAQERFTYSLIVRFGKALVDDSKELRDLQETLSASSNKSFRGQSVNLFRLRNNKQSCVDRTHFSCKLPA